MAELLLIQERTRRGIYDPAIGNRFDCSAAVRISGTDLVNTSRVCAQKFPAPRRELYTLHQRIPSCRLDWVG
jgi:hypothetical protein